MIDSEVMQQALDTLERVALHLMRPKDVEVMQALRAQLEQLDRRVMQAAGTHPAPCARFCESKAFEIEIRSLKSALRAALEQQAEPVAWIERDMQCDDFDPDSVTCEKQTIAADGWEWIPLYTAPPQRKPLTDADIKLVMDGRGEEGDDDYIKPAFDPYGISEDDLVDFARAVEQAHGIKETP